MNPGSPEAGLLSGEPQQAHDAVTAAIRQVLHDTGRTAGPVESPMLLGPDLGLDSLDIAQTVVLLERSLGVDPFRGPPPTAGRPLLRTVSDLVQIYIHALEPQPPKP
jgi:acyl carrier protein